MRRAERGVGFDSKNRSIGSQKSAAPNAASVSAAFRIGGGATPHVHELAEKRCHHADHVSSTPRANSRRNGARARRVVADARLSARVRVDWSIAPGHRRHRRVLCCARRIRGPAPRMGAPTRDDAVPHDDGRGDEAGRRQGEGRWRRQGQGQGPRAQAHAPGAEGCRTAREAGIEEQTEGPGAEGGDDGDPTRLGRRRLRRQRRRR